MGLCANIILTAFTAFFAINGNCEASALFDLGSVTSAHAEVSCGEECAVERKITGQLNTLKNSGQSGVCTEDKSFNCSYSQNSSVFGLGKLLHDHRYTDNFILSAESCKTDLKNSFDSPAELESFFANSSQFKVGAPALLITQCNPTDLQGGQKKDEEIKASIAEYYTDLARLNNSVKETLQAIAAIDSLKAAPLLAGVDCSISELQSSRQFCEELRNSCKPQGGNFEVGVKAKHNLVEKKKLLEEIRWFNENPKGEQHGDNLVERTKLSPEQLKEIDKRNSLIEQLEKDTPVIRDDSVAAKEINKAAKNNFDHNLNNPENIAKLSNDVFSKAEWDHNTEARSLLVERLEKLKGLAKCLGGHGECTDFDQIMEMTEDTEIPYAALNSKMDQRTQKGLKAYNAGLCQSQARRKGRQHGKTGTSITAAVGLTVASLLIPPLAESAGAAWVGAASTWGFDGFYLIDSGMETYKSCQSQLEQFHSIIKSEAKSSAYFCPKKTDPLKANALKNVLDCEKGIGMSVLASIPLVTALTREVAAFRKAADAVNFAEPKLNGLPKETHQGVKIADSVTEKIPENSVQEASPPQLPHWVEQNFPITSGESLPVSELKAYRDGTKNYTFILERDQKKILVRMNKLQHFTGHSFEMDGLKRAEKYGGERVLCDVKVEGKTAEALEYIEGETLENISHVTKNQCLQIKAIFDAATRDGVFLMDATPRNIMIDHQGEVRLIDVEAHNPHDLISLSEDKIVDTFGALTPNYVEKIKQDFRLKNASSQAYPAFMKKGGEDCAFLGR